MKMEVTYIHPDRLRPYKGNARTHTPEQVAQIAASIKEFGFTSPIICDGDNIVIAGHGRLLAAERLGLDAVPVIRLTHLSERQRRALTLADNRIALSSGWDFERLSVEIEALVESDFDLALTGFDEQELDALLKSDAGVLPESWAVGGGETAAGKNNLLPENFGINFTLPNGDKAPFQQMTFTLADAQAEVIKNAIADIKQTEEYKYAETMGNENGNGNALYLIVMQWAKQKK